MKDKQELSLKKKDENKMNKIYSLLINGSIKSMDEFCIACNELKVNYDYGRRKINSVLKNNGVYNKTLKDFIKPEPKIKKKSIQTIKKEELPPIMITDRFK